MRLGVVRCSGRLAVAIYSGEAKAAEISRNGGAVATLPEWVRLAGCREVGDGIEEGRGGVIARGRLGRKKTEGRHTVRARAQQRLVAVAAIRGDSGEGKLLEGMRWTAGSKSAHGDKLWQRGTAREPLPDAGASQSACPGMPTP